MKNAARLASLIGLAVLATGCASTPGEVVETAWTGAKHGVSTAFDATKGAFEKLARYTKIQDLLKKNHDASNHDDGEVVEVIAGKEEKKPAAKPRSGARPHGPASRVRQLPTGSFAGRFGWPVEAGIVSSEFGPRWGRTHKGIDIAADTGEPILAAADGEVIYSANGLRGYGNVVILRHDLHTTTLYAHNSALRCRLGERVKAGQTIALLGSTGHSTGPHCHFEVRDDREAVNPRTRLVRSRIFESQTLLADASSTSPAAPRPR